jgi:hypothetical protein
MTAVVFITPFHDAAAPLLFLRYAASFHISLITPDTLIRHCRYLPHAITPCHYWLFSFQAASLRHDCHTALISLRQIQYFIEMIFSYISANTLPLRRLLPPVFRLFFLSFLHYARRFRATF